MSHNLEQGRKGEDLALDYLRRKGWQIKARNWRYRKKEIDLIFTESDSQLIFVEVKARASDRYGRPEEFVQRSKQRFLIEAANAYAQKINWPGAIRFDVVAILFHPQFELKHLAGAFYP